MDHCQRQDAAFITQAECSTEGRPCSKVIDCLNSGNWIISTSESVSGAWVKLTFREEYEITSMAFSHRDYSDNYWEKFGLVRLELGQVSILHRRGRRRAVGARARPHRFDLAPGGGSGGDGGDGMRARWF